MITKKTAETIELLFGKKKEHQDEKYHNGNVYISAPERKSVSKNKTMRVHPYLCICLLTEMYL